MCFMKYEENNNSTVYKYDYNDGKYNLIKSKI